MKLRKPNFLKSPLEHYRESLEDAMATKAKVYREKSMQKKLPMVYTLQFGPTDQDPALGFSYGLSFAPHPDQPHRTELCLQMRSNEPHWIHVVGHLANRLRGDCPFHIGQIIRFGQTISPDSKLDAFLVIPPTEGTIPSTVKDGNKSTAIHLVELFPVFAQETPTIQRLGVNRFIRELADYRFDPQRISL